jgi:uncharacterized membrane protein YkvA (DUF1232 family)
MNSCPITQESIAHPRQEQFLFGTNVKRSIESLKQKAKELRTEAHALYLACKDPRVPWYARAFALCVAGYAFSPIDLIPDFIPVIGYLDDLIIVPLGIVLAIKMIPPDVLEDSRKKARECADQKKRVGWIAAFVIVGIWAVFLFFIFKLVTKG